MLKTISKNKMLALLMRLTILTKTLICTLTKLTQTKILNLMLTLMVMLMKTRTKTTSLIRRTKHD